MESNFVFPMQLSKYDRKIDWEFILRDVFNVSKETESSFKRFYSALNSIYYWSNRSSQEDFIIYRDVYAIVYLLMKHLDLKNQCYLLSAMLHIFLNEVGIDNYLCMSIYGEDNKELLGWHSWVYIDDLDYIMDIAIACQMSLGYEMEEPIFMNRHVFSKKYVDFKNYRIQGIDKRMIWFDKDGDEVANWVKDSTVLDLLDKTNRDVWPQIFKVIFADILSPLVNRNLEFNEIEFRYKYKNEKWNIV